MVAVVREDLAEEGSLADAGCAKEDGEARNGSEGSLEDSELRWSLEETGQGREGMRRWYCVIESLSVTIHGRLPVTRCAAAGSGLTLCTFLRLLQFSPRFFEHPL